jgi:hypothetical protein
MEVKHSMPTIKTVNIDIMLDEHCHEHGHCHEDECHSHTHCHPPEDFHGHEHRREDRSHETAACSGACPEFDQDKH